MRPIRVFIIRIVKNDAHLGTVSTITLLIYFCVATVILVNDPTVRRLRHDEIDKLSLHVLQDTTNGKR